MCVCAADSAGWCVCAHKSLTYTIPHKSLTYTILRARSLTDGRGEMALPSETSARTDCVINIACPGGGLCARQVRMTRALGVFHLVMVVQLQRELHRNLARTNKTITECATLYVAMTIKCSYFLTRRNALPRSHRCADLSEVACIRIIPYLLRTPPCPCNASIVLDPC